MKFWKTSLMARLVSYFLLLSLLTVSLVGYITYIQAKEALKSSVFERLEAVATFKQETLNRWVDDQRREVLLLASLPEIQTRAERLLTYAGSHIDAEYQSAYTPLWDYLTNILIHKPDIQEIFILHDIGGRIVLSTDNTHEGDYRLEDTYFIEGHADTFIQNVYLSALMIKPTMTISTPLYNPMQQRVGILAIHLNLDRMDWIIQERSGLGQSGETYLVDRFNVFVSSERFGREKFPRGVHTEGIDAAVQGVNGSGLYSNYEGIPVIGVYHWIADRELALLAEMHQEEAFAPARHLAGTILIVGLISAGILALGVYFLSRQIAQPILAITRTAAQVAAGDLSPQAPVQTEDEVGMLAQAFNQMTRELRTFYQNLEQKVEQRTAELAQAMKEAQESRAAAESANRAKSEFLAMMSHELRTPLNAILGYTQILKRDATLSAKQQGAITTIHHSGEHLFTMINDLLDLSKIEAHKMELQLRHFHLQGFLQSIVEIIQIRAQQKSITFEHDFSPDLPTSLYGDDNRLRQILLNLLNNAVKFTEHGCVTLKVTKVTKVPEVPKVERDTRQAPSVNLQFSIQDTGIGIRPDKLKEIFLPFQQVQHRGSRREGAGLGLAISQQLICLMGSELHVESVVGQGTRFWCDITFLESAANANDEEDLILAEHTKPSRQIIGFHGFPRKILIVDDKDENRGVFKDILIPLGFEIHEAVDGRDALEKVRAVSPDLVLMDLVMPVMDGFEATRRIRKIPELAQVKVLGISASAFAATRQESFTAGCDAFLTKPVQIDEFLNSIQQLLELEWKYEELTGREATLPLTAEISPTVIPPQDILRKLLELAEGGFVNDIQTLTEEIKTMNPDFLPFATKLDHLAENLQLDQIAEYVKLCLKR